MSRVTINEIQDLEKQYVTMGAEIARLKQMLPKEEVADADFIDSDGNTLALSALFGDSDELIMVHHMGRTCNYCNLWADNYNGITRHLESRAAFAVVNNDPPEVQAQLRAERGWTFKMVSAGRNSFSEAMGFKGEGGFLPGVMTFQKAKDGRIHKIAAAFFGPGDRFCSLWPFLDLLPNGVNGWEPE